MTSRSSLLVEKVVEKLPPTLLDGGTSTENLLYVLYTALALTEEIEDGQDLETAKRYTGLALRYALRLQKTHGKYFSKGGYLRRSAGKETI